MKNSNDNAVRLYREILKGERKRFPKNFFKENGKEKADAIFKYLFEEKLQWSNEKVLESLGYAIIHEYRLTSLYTKIYNKNIGYVIKSVYPDLIIGNRRPPTKITKKKISLAQKTLSPEKRQNITNGRIRINSCEKYIQKLSDTKLGELNPAHKLKAEQVVNIKKLWATGRYTATTLSEMFGVKRQTIADIVYGRTWKHI